MRVGHIASSSTAVCAAYTIDINPMAAVNLLSAEREFYRNRCQLLENEAITLRRQLESANKDKAPETKERAR